MYAMQILQILQIRLPVPGGLPSDPPSTTHHRGCRRAPARKDEQTGSRRSPHRTHAAGLPAHTPSQRGPHRGSTRPPPSTGNPGAAARKHRWRPDLRLEPSRASGQARLPNRPVSADDLPAPCPSCRPCCRRPVSRGLLISWGVEAGCRWWICYKGCASKRACGRVASPLRAACCEERPGARG